MNIGILTYHRSHNYGALLQAIALRFVLTNMGHKVSFIDYWPAYHYRMYALFSLKKLKSINCVRDKIRYIVDCFIHYNVRKQRRNNFNSFITKYIAPYISSDDASFDTIIYGSDQIWRKQPELNTYNPVYFGKHDFQTKKKVSYAASMGILPENESDKLLIKDYLSYLDKISVRESNLKTLIEKLGYNCELHLDPTLLLAGHEWTNLMGLKPSSKKKYVLYYKLMSKSFAEDELISYADSKGCDLITIYSSACKKNSEKHRTIADPLEFLDLIYNAEFVFTTSYHGLIFSLLLEKQFYASFRKNSARAESILSELGISNRLLPPMEHIPYDNENIDYVSVSKHMETLRSYSFNYLAHL